MRKVVLITAVALGLALLLAGVGPFLIPVATYQRIVEEAIQGHVDARVDMGRFRFRILPYPGYTISDFALFTSKAPFQGLPLLTAKRINGSLSFPSLLAGRIVTDLEVRDLTVDVRSAEGVTNIGTLLGIAAPGALPQVSGAEVAPAAPLPTAAPAGPGGFSPIPSMAAPSIDVTPTPVSPPPSTSAPAAPSPAAPSPAAPTSALPPVPAPAPAAPAPASAPAPTPPLPPIPVKPETVTPSPAAPTLAPPPVPAPAAPAPAAAPLPAPAPALPPIPVKPEGATPSPAAPIPAAPVPVAPSPAMPQQPAAPPQSWLGRALLTEAHAQAPGGAPAEDAADERLTVHSIEVTGGRINFAEGANAPTLTIGNVSVAAKELTAGAVISGQVNITGSVGGAAQPNVSVAGPVSLDRTRSEFTARGMRVFFNGAQLAVDVAIGYGLTPISYDLHAATPDLNPRAIEPILPLIGGKLPLDLSWQGTLGADASFKGTSDTGEFRLQFDATAARVAAGKTFVKEANLPFKATASAVVRSASIGISECALSFGGGEIGVSGEVLRDDTLTSRLTFSGKGLNLVALKALLPWLAQVDILEGMTMDVGAQGQLSSQTPLALTGRFTAARAEIAGLPATDLNGAFTRENESLSFPTLRGTFAGGTFSGNGTATFGAPSQIAFDLVLDNAEAAQIAALKGVLTGKISIVAKVTSQGEDGVTLAKNLGLSGSIVLPEAEIAAADGAFGLFTEDAFAAISEAVRPAASAAPAPPPAAAPAADAATAPAAAAAPVAAPAPAAPPAPVLNDAGKRALAGAGGTVKDVKAAFEIQEGVLNVPDVTFQQDLYSAKLAMSVDPTGKLQAAGEIKLTKAAAGALVTDAAAQKALFSGTGELPLPVIGSGTLALPKLSLEKAKLAALIVEHNSTKARVESAPAQVPAKPGKKGAKGAAVTPAAPATPVAPAAPAAKGPAAPAGAAPASPAAAPPPAAAAALGAQAAPKAATPKAASEGAPAPAPKKKQAAEPMQDPDDILKVIIGQ